MADQQAQLKETEEQEKLGRSRESEREGEKERVLGQESEEGIAWAGWLKLQDLLAGKNYGQP